MFKLPLWLLLFTIVFKDCYAVHCYECSWEEGEATPAVQDRKKKIKEEYFKELVEREDAVDYPLTQPFLIGEDKNPFEGSKIDTHCKPKSTKPCRYCVRWLLLDNNNKKNATFMCVMNSHEKIIGHFTQKMGHGLVKDVLVCDTEYCNNNRTTLPSSNLLLLLLLCFFHCTRKFIGL